MATVKSKSVIFEADLLALGEDVNAEVIDGELVIMAAAKLDHGIYGHRFHLLLGAYMAAHPIGRIVADQTTYITQEGPHGSIKDSLVPDISFISFERLPADQPIDVMPRIAPDLAIEIISASESPDAILTKTKRYLDFGVRQVWLVFHSEAGVRICTPQDPLGTLYSETDVLPGGDVLPGFAVPVRVIFDLDDNALLAKTLLVLLQGGQA